MPSCEEVELVRRASKKEDLARREDDWQIHRSDGSHVCTQESHVFELITLPWAWLLTESRSHYKDSESAMQHHLSLRRNRLDIFKMPLNFKVHD